MVNKEKKKRAVSAPGEGPATASAASSSYSRLLRVRKAWNNQGGDLSKKGRAGLPQEPPPSSFPVKIDGKEPYQVKAITSLRPLCTYTFVSQGGAALPSAGFLPEQNRLEL